MKLLSSALFWRILLSSLLVVGVLGFGMYRARTAHDELESEFERLVSHDLKLADDAEVLLRIMADLETGKRGYLLTGDRSFLMPYEQARRDLEGVLTEAQLTAENGMEDERVAAFSRTVRDWIATVSEPQIRAREKGAVDAEVAALGKSRTDEMRQICNELRAEALHAATNREEAAFRSAVKTRTETSAVLLVAIVIALGSGVWIARDLAGAAAQLEEALAATGKLEPLPPLPEERRDELGAVGRSLAKMARLLYEKDASLRATLAEREQTLARLTDANAELAARDADAKAYAEYVRSLKTLDLGVLSTMSLQGLVRLAGAAVGVLYLQDSRGELQAVNAVSLDGQAASLPLFSSEGLPRTVFESREPVLLAGADLGPAPPKVDLGVGAAELSWVLAQPIAVGEVSAGAVVVAGLRVLEGDRDELIADAARQFAVAMHNAWTYDRLREKSVMLAEQGETLARANKVKTEFLASMSHELRTPLSAIIGFADLLTESPRESLSARARESLERIKRNGEHLLLLINDVLDLAKAESGKMEIRAAPMNIVQLARACVAEVDSLRAGKDLRLVLDLPDVPIEVVTDSKMVRQVLLNLLSNAIKFTEAGEVVLTLRVEHERIELSVRDTGIGIPERALAELFKDFRQLDAGDGRRYPGTGIGLALSRRLARALGGEIEVRSTPGVGSTFTFTLPRSSVLDVGANEQVLA